MKHHNDIHYDREEIIVNCCVFYPELPAQSLSGSPSENMHLSKEDKISLRKVGARDPNQSQYNHQNDQKILPKVKSSHHRLPAYDSRIRFRNHAQKVQKLQQPYRNSLPTELKQSFCPPMLRYSIQQNAPIREQYKKSQPFQSNFGQERVGSSGYMISNKCSPILQQQLNRQNLVQTTRYAPEMDNQQKNHPNLHLQKTKKISGVFQNAEMPDHLTTLKNFKDSVFSVESERGNKVERLQESQVLVDYFNPPVTKVKQIEQFLSKQIIQGGQQSN